jgi:hypothetical protein
MFGRIPGVYCQITKPLMVGAGTLARIEIPSPLSLGLALGGATTLGLVDLRIRTGADELKPGPKAPPNTRFAVKPLIMAGTGVDIEAVLNTSQEATDLTWTINGQPVPSGGQRLLNLSGDGTANKYEVTCRLGKTSRTMVVYFFAAVPTGFNINGTSWSQDNKAPLVRTRNANAGFNRNLGLNPPRQNPGSYLDPCEIQFTVVPPALIADGENGLFDKSSLQFRVTRKARQRTWVQFPDSSGKLSWHEKTIPAYSQPNFVSDDSHSDDKDNDPWKTGHLYGNDAPGDDNLDRDDEFKSVVPNPALKWQGFATQFRMREFVIFRIGVPAGRNELAKDDDRECSMPALFWHVFHRVRKVKGVWENDPTAGNEMAKDDKEWAPPK